MLTFLEFKWIQCRGKRRS